MLRILLWLHVNITANTVSTAAINSRATAISTLPISAVTSAYATAKAGPLLAKWECLYFDSSRDILWNIACALGKYLGLRPWDFPRAQAIFHSISLLSSQYRYSISFLKIEYWDLTLSILPPSKGIFHSTLPRDYTD